MKKELFDKLSMSFKAMGMVGLTAAKAGVLLRGLFIQLNSHPFYFYNQWKEQMIKEHEHRRRCVIIAYALSKTCSPKKKYILWNLFKNVEF